MKKKHLLIGIGGIIFIGSILWGLYLLSMQTHCFASESHCATFFIENSKKKFYLDVREDAEWASGHVKGALHLKMGDILAGQYDHIPRDQEVHVYCRSGRRAGEIIQFLEGKGFTNLINAGGLSDLEGVEIVEGM